MQGLCTLWCIPPLCAIKNEVSICQFSIAVQFNLGIIFPSPDIVGNFWGFWHLLYLFLVGDMSSLGGGGWKWSSCSRLDLFFARGDSNTGLLLWHCLNAESFCKECRVQTTFSFCLLSLCCSHIVFKWLLSGIDMVVKLCDPSWWKHCIYSFMYL